MTDKDFTRRRILKAAGAVSGFALVPNSSVAQQNDGDQKKNGGVGPDPQLHSVPHDIGIYNNSTKPAEYEIKITGDGGNKLFEKQINLEGFNDPDVSNDVKSRFIGRVTAPGRGYQTIAASVGGQTETIKVLMNKNGIVDFGTVGIYVMPGGNLHLTWSMA